MLVLCGVYIYFFRDSEEGYSFFFIDEVFGIYDGEGVVFGVGVLVRF